jgi:glycosyltransferase involved in cell wall biosynthesis
MFHLLLFTPQFKIYFWYIVYLQIQLKKMESRHPKFSIIIPVYNRPDEVRELLQSLCEQDYTDFEVLVIEDGSSLPCQSEVEAFAHKLDVRYLFKKNSGQGFSRNVGMEKARGDYFVIFDSDCLIPKHYFSTVLKALNADGLDAWGGPDAAHSDFSSIQKAISYSMTSLFTTGGIRGRKKHAGVFHPRSFNMGISRKVFEKVGGFAITRMGEDIEYSIRIIRAGFKVKLIEEAFVYHKRRTNFSQFYKQLHFFGRARINIGRFYKNEIKVVHLFPTCFLLGLCLSLLLSIVFWPIGQWFLAAFAFYFGLIFFDSLIQNKSFKVAILSVFAGLIQLTAYGIGFLSELSKGFGSPR